MVALTEKQKRFCDEYLIDPNATQAAVRAGYSKKTARSIAEENLKKPHVKAYIEKRLKAIEDAKIADAAEIMQYFTAVMRGEEKDQEGKDAPLAERTKAAVELAKRIIDKAADDQNKDGKLLEILKAVKAIE